MIKKNLFWLFFDKGVRLLLALVVGAWVAKYLGPSSFGMLNFSLAIISMLGPFLSLGLNENVVKDLVRRPDLSRVILGSTFIAQFLSSLVVFSVILIWYFTCDSSDQFKITLIISASLLFYSVGPVRYFLESKIQGYIANLIELSVIILMVVLKVYGISQNYNLEYFTFVVFLELSLSSLGLFLYYQSTYRDLFRWSPDLTYLKDLLYRSFPIILSGVAVSLYMRIDQILIGKLLGTRELGIYTSALRLSEITYSVPIFVMATLFPRIVSLRDKSAEEFAFYFHKILKVLILISIGLILFFSIFSDFLISKLYGVEFEKSSLILKIHIWTSIFVFLGVAGNKWYFTENLQKLIIYQTLIGAIINLALNYYLIPKYGITGSAMSTLIAQLFSTLLFDLVIYKTRALFKLKLKALLHSIPWLVNVTYQKISLELKSR